MRLSVVPENAGSGKVRQCVSSATFHAKEAAKASTMNSACTRYCTLLYMPPALYAVMSITVSPNTTWQTPASPTPMAIYMPTPFYSILFHTILFHSIPFPHVLPTHPLQASATTTTCIMMYYDECEVLSRRGVAFQSPEALAILSALQVGLHTTIKVSG